MNLLGSVREIFVRWTDAVALAVVALRDRVIAPRLIRLVETDDPTGVFKLQNTRTPASAPERLSFANGRFSGDAASSIDGSRVELVLRSEKFLLRPLELPARATEFIDGIVRAQIDRLTPWSAAEAVFGCTPPAGAGNGKVTTTIAAAPRAAAEPYVAALSALNASSIAIFAAGPDVGAPPIKVFERQARGRLERSRVSGGLRLALAGTTLLAVLALLGETVCGQYFDNRRAELEGELTARRLALRLDRDGVDHSPIAGLAHRKNQTQASVVVLEELSRILPDNTYVTELRIDGNTVQIVGLTDDAPSLIRLMEQSAHFTRATFFAPTTHAPSERGDRFHVEAKLQPINMVSR
jgi:general secretion pathway protein L